MGGPGPEEPHKQNVKNVNYRNKNKTFNNGSLGSRIDEERSEMR
jgi:hypothetical protein